MINEIIENDSYILGIDLGTSNSCAAIMLEGNDIPKIIPNEFGLLTTPSFVTFLEPDKRLVGQLSKYNISSKLNTIFCSKRLLGKNYSDILKEKFEQSLPFKIIDDEESNKIKIEISFVENGNTIKKYYYPEQISAIILKQLKDDAEKYLSRKENREITIKKAVICTPAYFNQKQRKATKQAAEIAGLEVIGMINEPTAASLAYGLYKIDDENEERRIVIIDFGGGTLDFTSLIFSKKDGEVYCDVDGSFGDSNFGGVNFDIALMEEILKKNNIINDDINDKKLRLKLACEKCKINLSSKDCSTVILDDYSFSQKSINEYFTKNDFIKICNPLFEKFQLKLKEFLNVCNLEKKKTLISDIILIGGTTKIPKIKELIKNEFPSSTIREDLNPCTSVAIGAAIQASMIVKPFDSNINLLDVLNLSLGTNTYDEKEKREVMDIIIKRSSQLPAFGSKKYNPLEDYQTSIKNNIYEGDNKELSDNLLLGTLRISNLTKAKRGDISILLEFNIDKDSLLKVKATEISSNKNEEKLEIPEIVGIKEKELNELKREELKAELVHFPGYDNIRNNIIENQERINSNIKEIPKLYLENINMYISLLEKVDSKNIDKQLYFSFIKYIFSLLNYIEDPDLFKKRFKAIFIIIQFIDEKELFELLEDISDNKLTYHYCLTVIIKNYYSKMKEFYFRAFEKNKQHEIEKDLQNINACEKCLKFIENLLKKLPFPELIKEGLKTEISLFPLKIEIRRFLLNKDAFSDPQKKALDYGNKIDNNIFFFNEIEELSEINIRLKEKKKKRISLNGEDDAQELYHLLKFNGPRKLNIQIIKSEKDFKEEIKIFINNCKTKNSPKTGEEADFRKIFCKNGTLLDNEDNRNLYIKIRKEKEDRKKKKI